MASLSFHLPYLAVTIPPPRRKNNKLMCVYEPKTEITNKVTKITGYTFKNKELVVEAFTQESSKHEADYEQLEFFGDAVLYLLVTMMYRRLYPELRPKQLSQLRNASVSNEKLARATIKHGFDRFVIPSKRESFEDEVHCFKERLSLFPSDFTSMVDPPKILADVMEALVGAVFIDSDSSITTTMEVTELLLKPMFSPQDVPRVPGDVLDNVCREKKLRWEVEEGPAIGGGCKAEVFTIAIDKKVGREMVGYGWHKTKPKIAKQRAIYDAYKELLHTPPEG